MYVISESNSWARYVPLMVTVARIMTITTSSAIPEPDHKTRVLDQPLSDEEHYVDEGEHSRNYDHEAFLGKDDVKTFDELTPEDSKIRLQIIYDKIDKDQNNQLSEEELSSWIQYVQNRYIRQDTERQWSNYQGTDTNGMTLSWDVYKDRTYGHVLNDEEGENKDDGHGYSYKDTMKRDAKRWSKADRDNDGSLTKDEFMDFLHPEESENLKDIIIDETLEDIDKDKDGSISLDEYIKDMWRGGGDGDRDDEEPDWVKTEREQFTQYRDKNKDGFMNRDEVRDWVMPDDYDHSKAEAKHLIYESDADKDGFLTKEEVVEKYDLFVGSQATDFGEYLLRKHDEF